MPLLSQQSIGELIGDVSKKIFPNIGSLVVQLLATIVLVFFVIKFFYEHLVLNKSLIDAYNFSMQNDEETKLYKIFK